MNPDSPATDPAPSPEPRGDEPTPTETLAGALPRDLGVMLVTAGVIGFVLPGPGVPALVAGGMILWPKGFGKVERWAQKRFPSAHRQGMTHLNRFLSDLERRYPGSTGSPQGGPGPETS